MTPRDRSSAKGWTFSLLLGVSYLSIFHLWGRLSPSGVFISAVATAALLCLGLLIAWGLKYFLSFWEALLHLIVILDILLEGVLIPSHESRSFYWCALAFAILIVGYRLHLRRRLALKQTSS